MEQAIFNTQILYLYPLHLHIMFTYITCRVFKFLEDFYSHIINFLFFYSREKRKINGLRMYLLIRYYTYCSTIPYLFE